MGARPQSARATMARKLLIDLAIMTAIGVTLAVIGPLGSFNEPFAIRLIVWLGFSYLGYVLYSPIDTVAQRLAPSLDLPVWSVRVVACIVASVFMAIAVWILPRLPDRLRLPSADEAIMHYLYTLMIGGLITIIVTLVAKAQPSSARPEQAARPESEPVTQSQARFLDRLPPALGSDLLALEMEDHYVRAHTALGSELVLMRMRDAVAELDGLEGAQIHRSWWVARGAVCDVKRDGRNLRLELGNGIEAPVSRANVKPLKDAGWF